MNQFFDFWPNRGLCKTNSTIKIFRGSNKIIHSNVQSRLEYCTKNPKRQNQLIIDIYILRRFRLHVKKSRDSDVRRREGKNERKKIEKEKKVWYSNHEV